MRKPAAAASDGESPKDRRLLALLALAVLLVGVAVGVELCRRLFARVSPGTLAGDYEFRLPPAAVQEPPAPVPQTRARPVRTMSAAKFLATLAQKTPKSVARKFVSAFAGQPRLRQVFKDATRKGLDQTPAPELIRALMAAPEFRAIVVESRADPGFREAFQELASNPELGSTLRAGTVSLVRTPEDILPAGPVTGRLPAAAGAGLYEGAPPAQDSEEAPEAESPPNGDARQERQTGEDAHNVSPGLKRLESVKSDRQAVAYFNSVFVGLPRRYREELEDACAKHDLCDPKDACVAKAVSVPGILEACKRACLNSPKCPKDMFSDVDSGGDLDDTN